MSCVKCEGEVHARGLCHIHYRQDLAIRRKTKLCACGCGALCRREFLSGHNTRLHTDAEQWRRAQFNDGAKQRARGDATSEYYRKVRGRHEHRQVMEAHLGRPLLSAEIVHHVNHNRRDNRLENLQVMSQSAHIKLHEADLRKGKKWL